MLGKQANCLLYRGIVNDQFPTPILSGSDKHLCTKLLS